MEQNPQGDNIARVLQQRRAKESQEKDNIARVLQERRAKQQQEPTAETPPFLQAPPQQVAGGGAPSTASVAPQAQQPLPSAPDTRLPTPQTDPAAAAFNMAQVLGEDFKPANAAEAALDVAAKKYAAITRIGKKAPYVDVPQRDVTQDKPVIKEQQYSPALMEQKKAAGRWTAEDELRFKQTETRNAADVLKQRRIALAKKVEAQGAVTPEDEQEMAMIESDRMLLADSYEQSLKEFARDPMVVAKTQEQKAADVEFGRAQKYVEKGDILRPEVLNEYVMRPVANAINSFGMNAIGGALRTLDAIGNLPADATGSERYYSPFAQTADWITEGLDYISAGEGTATKQGIFGDDWSVNSDALLPQFLRTGVYMAGLVASGNAGGTGALGITSFLTTEEDYYREAIDAGLSPSDAQKFSIGAAAATAALEGINPQIYSAGTVKGQMAKKALAALKDGKSTKEAIKDATEFVAKEIGGENVQEFAQAGSDMLARYVTNEALGEERLDATMTAQQAAETAVLTTALSGLVAGAARAADRPLYQQSIEWAVKNPDEMRRFIAMSVPQAEQEAVVAELERFEKVYNGLPENLSGPAKREVASAVAEKQRIKEEQSASIIDDVVASITGNKYEEAIKKQDERIAQATGTSLADIIRQQEVVKLQEQYDRAKLKSEVTGNPMPEGMTRPKDVTITPPTSEVEIAQTDGEAAATATTAQETAIEEGVSLSSEGGAGVAEGQAGAGLEIIQEPQQSSQTSVPESLTETPVAESPQSAPVVAEEPAAPPPPPPAAEPKVPKPKKPKQEEAKITLDYKRPSATPVASVTELVRRKDDKGKTIDVEFAIPGFEEYPTIAYKSSGGWLVAVKNTGTDIPTGGTHPTPELAIAAASEAMNRAGKEKLDKALGAAIASNKSLADKIRALKVKPEAGQLGAFIIPPQVFNAAIEAVALAVEAGAKAIDAVRNGIAALRESEWYNSLSDPDKKTAEENMTNATRASVSPMRDLVKRASKNVSASIKNDIAAQGKEFAKMVQDVIGSDELYGSIKNQQLRALVGRAAKVDPRNDAQVERFIRYAERVVSNANYAEDVKRAKAAKKKASKMSRRKNVPINHVEVLEDIARIDTDYLKDPAGFAERVDEYLKMFSSVTGDKYTPRSSQRMGEYVDKVLRNQSELERAYYLESLMDEGVMDVEEGSEREIYEAIMAGEFDAYEQNLTDSKKRDIDDRLSTLADLRRAALNFSDADQDSDLKDLAPKHRVIVDSLKKATPESMNAKQKAEYIRVVDNILISGSFSGSAYAAAVAESSSNIGQALAESKKFDARELFNPFLAESFVSLPQAFRSVFGGNGPGVKIQRLMGLTAFNAAKKQWSDTMKSIDREYADFYVKLRKKYPTSHSEGAKLAEGMTAWAIQSMPGLDPEQSFENNKEMLLEDIRRRSEARKLRKQAPVLQDIYDRVIGPAKTREEALELLKKSYPSAYDAIQYTIGLGKKYAEQLKQHDEDVWNERGDWNDPYYIHKSFVANPGSAESLDPDTPRNIRFHESLKPSQAKGLKARSAYRSLSPDRLINYDMRHASLRNLSKSLYDYHTAEPQMRVSEFMKMPEARRIFGSGENRDFIQSAISRYMKSEYMAQRPDWADKTMNKLANYVRGVAVGRALGGFLQLPKQFSEAMVSGSAMLGGRADRVFANMTNIEEASDLLNTFSIGDRAGVVGGTKWEGRLRQELSNLESAITNNVFDKASNLGESARNVWMKPLSVGDSSSAKAVWLSAYEQYRGSQGHKVTSWKEEGRQVLSDDARMDAAQYAEDIVDNLFTPSDPAKAASIVKRGETGWKNMGKIIILPFASFGVNSATRTLLDAGDIYGWGKNYSSSGTPAPSAAAKSLLAKGAGTAAFLAVSQFFVPVVKSLVADIMESGFDDDEEGDDSFAYFVAALHGMYVLGFMDADVYRSASARQYEREKRRKSGLTKEQFKQTEQEKRGVRNMKVFQTRLLLEATSIGVQQQVGSKAVEFLNWLEYRSLVDGNDPSIYTQSGTVKDFSKWRKDPSNVTFYLPGQGIDKGTELGLLSVVISLGEDAQRRIDSLQEANDKEAVEGSARFRPGMPRAKRPE